MSTTMVMLSVVAMPNANPIAASVRCMAHSGSGTASTAKVLPQMSVVTIISGQRPNARTMRA
jgi:hypothetical protein